MSKVKSYTGIDYDLTIIQVTDALESSQHRAGNQTLGESQVIFLENLGTSPSPSHGGMRVLSRKLEHACGSQEPVY